MLLGGGGFGLWCYGGDGSQLEGEKGWLERVFDSRFLEKVSIYVCFFIERENGCINELVSVCEIIYLV